MNRQRIYDTGIHLKICDRCNYPAPLSRQLSDGRSEYVCTLCQNTPPSVYKANFCYTTNAVLDQMGAFDTDGYWWFPTEDFDEPVYSISKPTTHDAERWERHLREKKKIKTCMERVERTGADCTNKARFKAKGRELYYCGNHAGMCGLPVEPYDSVPAPKGRPAGATK